MGQGGPQSWIILWLDNDTEKVVVKISDGILNSFQVPNFRYISRNAVARKNSLGQAKELLSNNMPK